MFYGRGIGVDQNGKVKTEEEYADTIVFALERNLMTPEEIKEVLMIMPCSKRKRVSELVNELYLQSDSKSPLL